MAWGVRNLISTQEMAVTKNILRMKEDELDLALEAEPFDLGLRRRLEGLR